jgi:hypothetical protein
LWKLSYQCDTPQSANRPGSKYSLQCHSWAKLQPGIFRKLPPCTLATGFQSCDETPGSSELQTPSCFCTLTVPCRQTPVHDFIAHTLPLGQEGHIPTSVAKMENQNYKKLHGWPWGPRAWGNLEPTPFSQLSEPRRDHRHPAFPASGRLFLMFLCLENHFSSPQPIFIF